MKPVQRVGVRDGYDRWASSYDIDGNPLVALDDGVVPRLLGDVRGKTVLDLACGTGRHTARLVDDGAIVTGVDFSPRMLDVARGRVAAGAAVFVEADATQRLPFEDSSFDAMLCCLALEHVEILESVFAEAKRVLRRGGVFVCSDMHPAMRLAGKQANFDDPDGVEVRVAGFYHPISDYVMATLRAGFGLECIEEHAPDAALAERFPRAARYVGWPMLVALRARA